MIWAAAAAAGTVAAVVAAAAAAAAAAISGSSLGACRSCGYSVNVVENIYKNESHSLSMAQAMTILPDAIFCHKFWAVLGYNTKRSNGISLTDILM
jgi:hypothetical protein